MRGRPRKHIDEAEFRRMYQSNLQLSQICDHFKISKTTIRALRIRYGMKPNRQFMSTLDENEFRRLYEEGVTYPEMAKILGMSRCTAMAIRERLNLPNRYNVQKKVEKQ
jgi:hypothetical protein